MDDLIRREDALNCFHSWIDKHGDVWAPDDMPEYQAIEALPPAGEKCLTCRHSGVEWDEEPCDSCAVGGEASHWEPKSEQWIPVGERLPEKPGKYLVSVRNGNVYAGTFDKISNKFQCAALAWMPLPEPYREEDE